MKRFLLSFALAATLTATLLSTSGCVLAAGGAVASAGGAILYDKRSVHTMMQDAHIAQTAQQHIDDDPHLNNRSHIHVDAFNYRVLMIGEADNASLRARAARIVRSVPGIKRIYNQVNIAPAASTKDNMHDTWITTKIKTALIGVPGLHTAQVKVITEKAVVYLMGHVTRAQGNDAADTVRKVKGVRKVVKVFEYGS